MADRIEPRLRRWQHLTLALAFVATTTLAQTQAPQAARQPRDVTVHGDTRIDDYFWLRERDKPAVLEHLKAEAAYTDQWFKPLEPLRERLYGEMVGRIKQADEGVPAREGQWWYSTRTVEGAQYAVQIRRAARGPQRAFDAGAPEQVVLDVNELAKNRKFLAVGEMRVSPDAKWLAYSIDETGARNFELHVRDIASGVERSRTMPRAAGVVWAADSRTLFYVTTNEAKRRDKVWRHRLDGAAADELVFEEKDPLFNLRLGKSADGRLLLLTSSSKDTTEMLALRADRPRDTWRPLLARRTGVEYDVEHRDGRLYLTINDRGPNFRLASLPLPRGLTVAPAALARATELIAHRDDAMLERVRMFRDHLAVQVREQGSVKLRVYDHARFRPRELAFDDPVYVAAIGFGQEYDSSFLRAGYQSQTTPFSTYDYDFATGRLELKKRQPVLGGYDPARYASERRWTTAPDGTRVPISLVYAKDKRAAGPQALLLRGYGSYGMPNDPRFSANDLSLLDRGVVIAIAHVRGGGDLGRRWYLDGKLDKKMNTFNDFVAVAETLIRERWTTPERLVITGGSAGGLLMGAVVNMRPELFKAVVAEVPFVDVINTMLDETLPLTTEEFIEWGNPKIPEQYAWIRAYSPYDNLKPGAYPAILARTGINDSQVPYWEAAKYVAKLRSLKTDANPLLFDINLHAGHGGASGRFDALKERAKAYAFMLQQWGLVEDAGTAAPAAAAPAPAIKGE